MLTRFLSKGNIRSRILKALLGVASVSLLSFAIVSLDGMRRLGEFSVQSSSGLGQEALKISKSALETLTQDGLQRITTDQANLCNAQFKQAEATVNVLADLAEKLWNNPGAYPENRSYAFNEVPKDPSFVSVYQFPKGVDANRFKGELDISSSMDTFFKPILQNNPTISDLNIGAPSGLFRRFPWGPVSPEYDVRKRDWYKRAIDSGKEGWSDPLQPVVGLGWNDARAYAAWAGIAF